MMLVGVPVYGITAAMFNVPVSCEKKTTESQTKSITKQKSSTVKENAGMVRVKGIELCEQLLTTVSSSIASYAPLIDDIVAIIKDIVADDGFFSSLTLHEKKEYVHKLENTVIILEEQKMMVSHIRAELTRKRN